MGRAEDWRQKSRELARKRAVELDLPSGARILARKPGPEDLLRWGRLPAALLSALDTAPAAAGSLQETLEIMDFLREVLCWCCLEPRVSLDPQSPEETHPREIEQEDWVFIVNWALRVEEGRALEGFRAQRGDAGAGGDGQDVRPAAVEPGGDRGPGFSAGV